MRTDIFYTNDFAVAAANDTIYGILIFLFYEPLYSAFTIEIPVSIAYIHITAAFVFVQGISYFFVFLNLQRNIDIVKVGLIYKSIYSLLAFYYWFISQIPHPMFGIFGIIDIVFVVLFALYLKDYEKVIMQAA